MFDDGSPSRFIAFSCFDTVIKHAERFRLNEIEDFTVAMQLPLQWVRGKSIMILRFSANTEVEHIMTRTFTLQKLSNIK